tara:strand:- start:148 stop:405 length:258 start_codon:yes stop_codon:yes gene_type:complete
MMTMMMVVVVVMTMTTMTMTVRTVEVAMRRLEAKCCVHLPPQMLHHASEPLWMNSFLRLTELLAPGKYSSSFSESSKQIFGYPRE